MSSGVIILCAGGTGGHVFPARAVAEVLETRGWDVRLMTDERGAQFVEGFDPSQILPVAAANFAAGKLRGLWRILRGVLQARATFARLKPRVVVGFGGYPALPGMVAAISKGIPSLIHEQNAVLGRVNRRLGGYVKKLALSFTNMRGLKDSWALRLSVTGNPVRAGIVQRAGTTLPAVDGTLNLLVLGGSQGARILSDVVPEAITRLPHAQQSQLRLVQQCRPEDLERVTAAYADSGAQVELASFFDDVPDRLAACHLVVGRAGASTCSEIAVIGRPAILVPFAAAMDDHQTANAADLKEAGAAWVLPESEFTATALRDLLMDILDRPVQLSPMAAAAAAVGRPNAAQDLANLVEGLTSRGMAA